MASIKANVTPELLSWARRSAGYALEEAAKKINNISAEKLAAWEEGTDQPTVKQLYKVAEVYKRTVGTFFLSERPQDFTIPRDFRRLPGEVAGVYSPALRRQIRLAEERRETALELFEDLGEEPPPFPLAATLDDDRTSSPAGFAWRSASIPPSSSHGETRSATSHFADRCLRMPLLKERAPCKQTV